MFIDSDDEYDKKVCEIFYDLISDSGCDLICCGIINLLDDFNQSDIPPVSYNEIRIKNEDIFYFNNVFIFNKIYKRSIISDNNISFPPHKYGEDLQFNMRYLMHCNEISYIPNYIGYYRHVRHDSISRSWTLEDLSNLIITYSDIYHELIKSNLNIDYGKSFKPHIEYIFFKLCALRLLEDKSKIIKLLNELYSFEQEISFNGKLISKAFEIVNIFLLKKQFGIAYYYLCFLEKLYNVDKIKMMYGKLINLRK